MNERRIQYITRTGLLLAATLLLQGLRLLIPIPPQVSMFLIGSLVNACLVAAVYLVGRRAAVFVAAVTPVFAFFEGMLPFFPFILPVAIGNSIFIVAIYALRRYGLLGIYGAAICKAVAMYGAFYGLFSFVAFPPAVRHMILLTMSWPQVVTGVLGGTMGYMICKRLHHYQG